MARSEYCNELNAHVFKWLKKVYIPTDDVRNSGHNINYIVIQYRYINGIHIDLNYRYSETSI